MIIQEVYLNLGAHQMSLQNHLQNNLQSRLPNDNQEKDLFLIKIKILRT